MIDAETQYSVDVSILEILVRYDKAWLPPSIAEVCEPMEVLGLLERDGEQWRITDAGRAMIRTCELTRH